MIPRIIHYCWYGKPLRRSLIAYKCVRTFSKIKNVYIKEWNENNCSCDENKFVQKAKLEKKWAFVSDYYRLKALYESGGIYCDTDLEIKKEIPEVFFEQKCILGFMFDNMVSSAFIMAEPHCELIHELLEYYEDDRVPIGIANNELYTSFLKAKYPNFLLNGRKQELEIGVFIYPKEYFECPTYSKVGGYSVHHFAASWISRDFKCLRKAFNIMRFYIPILDWIFQTRGRKRSYYSNRFYRQAEIDRFK